MTMIMVVEVVASLLFLLLLAEGEKQQVAEYVIRVEGRDIAGEGGPNIVLKHSSI